MTCAPNWAGWFLHIFFSLPPFFSPMGLSGCVIGIWCGLSCIWRCVFGILVLGYHFFGSMYLSTKKGGSSLVFFTCHFTLFWVILMFLFLSTLWWGEDTWLLQIPTSPLILGGISHWAPSWAPRTNRGGISWESELTNLQIGRAPFSPRRFMSISFLRLYTDIHRAGLAKAGWRCGDGQKKRNVSLKEFQGGGMQLNLLWKATTNFLRA